MMDPKLLTCVRCGDSKRPAKAITYTVRFLPEGPVCEYCEPIPERRREHDPKECKGTYAVECLSCGQRVPDTGEPGPAHEITLAADNDRLRRWLAYLHENLLDRRAASLCAQALKGDEPHAYFP